MRENLTRIFVAGHNGMVGSALIRQLSKRENIEVISESRELLDFTNQADTIAFLKSTKPDVVLMAAAKVGGIRANNDFPAEFIYQNLMIEANLVHGSYLAGVKRLLFLGSSCIYPKFAEQPMREDALLSGHLEPTNEPYAVAKIAGIKLCESYNRQYGVDYRSVMPTNLYGVNDDFHPLNSHVIPGLLRRFHEAKVNGDEQVVVWGSGNVRREFLHVDDMAEASLLILDTPKAEYDRITEPMLSHVNVGYGQDVTIRELALTMSEVVGYPGEVIFDASKPEGTPRKLIDIEKLTNLGWQPTVDLKTGLHDTYAWFIENYENLRV